MHNWNYKILFYKQTTTLLYALLCVALFSSCSLTKFVPEDKYLLNDVKVRLEDTKDVATSDLMKYVQQKQNTEILGFWKLQLNIYNTASKDTTKWTSKNARKIGEAPVVFDAELTDASCTQLQRAMNNKGYFRAQIDTTMTIKDRKVNLVYHVTADQPYMIRTYSVDLPQAELKSLARNSRSLISNGMQFDADILNEERRRVASAMRRRGYFYFDQELLRFDADSTRGKREIDVTMKLHDYLKEIPAEDREKIFRKYRIAHVHFHLDYDPSRIPDAEEMASKSKDGFVFTWVGKQLLHDKVLIRNCPFEPGDMYNERMVERAYTRFNQLAPVKYVDISFEPISADELDCHIVLSRGKLHSISAEIEGTYSAGDWGVAAGAGYVNRNLFRGAEELSVNGRASYEWRQNGGRAIEAKAAAGLKFPNQVSLDLNYDFQNRPDEYMRSIFGAGLNYSIRQPRVGLEHQFRFVDISYVYLPWVSDAFRNQFLQSTNIL